MDIDNSEGHLGTSGEANGHLPPVHRSFAHRVRRVALLACILVAVGGTGFWLRGHIRAQRLESLLSHTRHWPPLFVTIEPGVQCFVSLRTRCSHGLLYYILTFEPNLGLATSTLPTFLTDSQMEALQTEYQAKIAATLADGTLSNALSRRCPLKLRFYDDGGFECLAVSVPREALIESVNSSGRVTGLRADGKANCPSSIYSALANWSPSWVDPR